MTRVLTISLPPLSTSYLSTCTCTYTYIPINMNTGTGHSMGGHGAWVAAVSNPDDYVCVVPVSSWIGKEDYHVANAFFSLDPQVS